MKNYICKKELTLEKYDDGGFWTGDYITIPVGKVFRTEEERLLIATPPAIRLVADDMSWLEIGPETLREYFKEEQKCD